MASTRLTRREFLGAIGLGLLAAPMLRTVDWAWGIFYPNERPEFTYLLTDRNCTCPAHVAAHPERAREQSTYTARALRWQAAARRALGLDEDGNWIKRS